MREINEIYIHCSALPYGSFVSIDGYHKKKGWCGVYCPVRECQIYCGYNYVILNEYPTKFNYDAQRPVPLNNGKVIVGRPEDAIPAHVEGKNTNSIGIVYVGVSITFYQLVALKSLLQKVLKKYNLGIENVKGHYEVFGNADEKEKLMKTCPNIRMDLFRNDLSHYLKGGD